MAVTSTGLVYMNGILVLNIGIPVVPARTNRPIILGGSNLARYITTLNRRLIGNISNFFVTNNVLTLEQIYKIYKLGSKPLQVLPN